MSVLDKFMDMMRLNDDDYDDEYYDDDIDEEYDDDPKPRGGLFGRRRDDSQNDVDDDYTPSPRAEKKAYKNEPVKKASSVTPMRSSKSLLPNMEVCVVKPTQLDDSREIINTLLAGRTVILNLEGLDLEIAQRIIDFTSGAAYAIDGKLQKISSYIFLVTPPNVEITGDLQDLFGSGSLTASSVSRF